ncbi:hypothetical protein [Hymenobacter sp. PAMC 26628]|uniref:hypothetical protein n=1 Tax=Hymenobacter sp. PAMC 26628 TaxID=1484118 RepID=UPI0007700C80|nr:hypothetical protein [Hymenobacter sp. PAMC 26628]AMJ66390.1 hypothetical protein AXW84_13830 [Hymenobacter sp. PAMC 26628]
MGSVRGWWWLAALLGGCALGPDKSQGPTTAAGQVVEMGTNKPLPNAQVQVWAFRGGGVGGSGGGFAALGAPHLADAQGRFAFGFDAEEGGSYRLRAFRDPGYLTNWGYDVGVSNGQENNDLRVPVQAPAWVRIQLVDEPPKNRISIYISGYEGNGERISHPRDTALIRPCIAGLTKSINWFITNDKGLETSAHQDVDLKALDTLTVRIPF